MASRGLSGLLALTLVACGGRYSSSEASGSAGASSGGGAAEQGGPSSGAGGGAAGGGVVGMAGVGVGVAGSTMGTAGAPTGSGGATVVMPSDPRTSCEAYCEAVARVCPEKDAYACSKSCYSDLIGSPCPERLRRDYECVAAAVSETGSCEAASSAAARSCDASGLEPRDCDEPCEISITFDERSCRAVVGCGSRQAELHCSSKLGEVTCECWVDGKAITRPIMPPQSFDEACKDLELQETCLGFALP